MESIKNWSDLSRAMIAVQLRVEKTNSKARESVKGSIYSRARPTTMQLFVGDLISTVDEAMLEKASQDHAETRH